MGYRGREISSFVREICQWSTWQLDRHRRNEGSRVAKAEDGMNFGWIGEILRWWKVVQAGKKLCYVIEVMYDTKSVKTGYHSAPTMYRILEGILYGPTLNRIWLRIFQGMRCIVFQ